MCATTSALCRCVTVALAEHSPKQLKAQMPRTRRDRGLADARSARFFGSAHNTTFWPFLHLKELQPQLQHVMFTDLYVAIHEHHEAGAKCKVAKDDDVTGAAGVGVQ
jgi:hypothetical protein